MVVLAGLAAGWLADRFPRGWRPTLATLRAIAAVRECLVGIARTNPYTDPFYNIALGGLKGTERSGFEVTYYWETIGSEFLATLRATRKQEPVTLCIAMDMTNHDLLHEWGELPSELQVLHLNVLQDENLKRSDYDVQQRRARLFYPADMWLDRHGHPVFTIRREGVNLLRVYLFEEMVELLRRTKNVPIPQCLSLMGQQG